MKMYCLYSVSYTHLQGNISHFIEDLREDLIKIITQIEVNIDYPEYEDVEELTADSLLPKSQLLKEKMNHIIESSQNVHLLKDGISTVIIGKPNVGKSSLLNALLNEDKAIVTDIAGTTRDIVEGTIRLDNIILNMIDTAGIRETNDIVENIGVNKSKELIHKADLVLLVLDSSSAVSYTHLFKNICHGQCKRMNIVYFDDKYCGYQEFLKDTYQIFYSIGQGKIR